MRDDLFGNDPKTIWQNQPTELSTMTLEKVRQKALELHAKTRKELFSRIAVALFTVALSSAGIVRTHDPVLRLVFAFAIAWTLAGQYFIHRGMWSARPPGDAALITGLEFYRHEVKRRRYLFHRVLQWTFGPVILSIGALILPIVMIAIEKNHGAPVQMTPFFTLFVVWLVAFFILRLRGQRDLQREINELNDIEKENHR
jgi:hypothetical protein